MHRTSSAVAALSEPVLPDFIPSSLSKAEPSPLASGVPLRSRASPLREQKQRKVPDHCAPHQDSTDGPEAFLNACLSYILIPEPGPSSGIKGLDEPERAAPSWIKAAQERMVSALESEAGPSAHLAVF